MKIVTYNLERGGRKAQWDWLSSEGFDLIFVQEASDPRANDSARWRWRERAGWGTGVWAKTGRMGEPIDIPGFGGDVVAVEIRGMEGLPCGARDLLAIGLHNPLYHPQAPATIQRLVKRMPRPERLPIVLAGDFNTGSLGPRQQGEGLASTKVEQTMLAALREKWDVVPCWSTANPGKPQAQTHRWTRNPATAFHCDGVFVPTSWAAQSLSCEVVNRCEAPLYTGGSFLSDHNPVRAEIIDAS